MANVNPIAGATGPACRRVESPAHLRALLAVQLGLFGGQLIMGMVVNLYVQIPDVHPGTANGEHGYFVDLVGSLIWAMSGGPVGLTLHVFLGLALILLGLALVHVARSAGRTQIALLVAGVLLTIGAAFNGGSFLIFGNDDNLSSLLMEILFTSASACYIVALVGATPVGQVGKP